MIELKAKNEDEAKMAAVVLSRKHQGRYVTVIACFGLFATLHSRLNVFAPSDSVFTWYVLNGQVKQFTMNQVVADQMNTPVMA